MTDTRGNVFLVGMMGAGKSAVGRQLARRLDMPFVDSDHEICERTGVPIATIFELEGEQRFRDREARVIDELSQRNGVVLATGGGAVLSDATRAHLRARGTTIYLHARVQDLWLRTRNDRSRPLLAGTDPRQRLEALLAEREALYREVAHLVVHTGKPTVSRLVGTIIEQLESMSNGAMRASLRTAPATHA